MLDLKCFNHAFDFRKSFFDQIDEVIKYPSLIHPNALIYDQESAKVSYFRYKVTNNEY